tara:strand:- start:86 stop:385 length:300 start_codon:yes stop_codon:yes gene_type:complete
MSDSYGIKNAKITLHTIEKTMNLNFKNEYSLTRYPKLSKFLDPLISMTLSKPGSVKTKNNAMKANVVEYTPNFSGPRILATYRKPNKENNCEKRFPKKR